MPAQSTFPRLLLIHALCLLYFAGLASAQENASGHAVFILGAQANQDNTLTITGQNFGKGSPIVNLDGNFLAVSNKSDTQIVVKLPAALTPGVHMLAVSSSPESTEFGMFSVRIIRAETEKPQDAQGPAELRIAGMKEYTAGHFVEARRLFDRAMTLAVEKNDTYLIALIHGGVGNIYQDEFEFAKAEQEFIKAIDILRRQPDHSHALAMTLANFGGALCGEGRYQEASTSLSEASRLIKNDAINDPQLEVEIFDVFGTVYFREGQLKKAENLFQRALRVSLLPQNAAIPEAADLFNNLATLYAAKGNDRKAAVYYTRALDTAEKRLGPSHPSTTIVLVNLGVTYIRMRRYEEAESQFLRSLKILESHGLMVSKMGLNTLNGLGQTYAQRNQLQRAEPLLARAVETGRAIKAQTPEMAEALDLYSTVLRSLSRHAEAENMHSEAARIRAELVWTTHAGR